VTYVIAQACVDLVDETRLDSSGCTVSVREIHSDRPAAAGRPQAATY
jgi:hypothetical protein